MADFPTVPDVPGVPALSRDPTVIIEPIILLIADAISSSGGDTSAQWGIFLDGAPVVVADSVVTFDYKQDWTISDYPVEEGGFESYDKVQVPFSSRVRFASGGSEQNRQALLNSIAGIANTLSLYDVVTPDEIYQSVSVVHYDYRRSALNGVGMIVIDVWLTEVRVTATSSFSNTQSPTGANQTNGGQVTPQTPNQIVQSDFEALGVQ